MCLVEGSIVGGLISRLGLEARWERRGAVASWILGSLGAALLGEVVVVEWGRLWGIAQMDTLSV